MIHNNHFIQLREVEFNPRIDQDNLGVIYSVHDAIISEIELPVHEMKTHYMCVFPFYITSHSGYSLHFNYKPNDPWDTSFGGYICVSEENIRKFGIEGNTDQITKILKSELEELTNYLNGGQYEAVIYPLGVGEMLEDYGSYSEVLDKAKEYIDSKEIMTDE